MQLKSNIALIGMPGCGKSTIGSLLARRLSMQFVDTDSLIEKKEGLSLIGILHNKGNDYFLKTEEAVIQALHLEKTVIATGGSAVLSANAMTHLARLSVIIYLEADLRLIKKRLWNYKTRGIVSEPGKSVDDLYRERRPLYRSYSDIRIRIRGKKPGAIVDEIMKKVSREDALDI